MRRSVEFLRLLLNNPIAFLAILYAYWIISVPPAMIIWGLYLCGIYFVITVLEKIFYGNQFISFVLLITTLLLALLFLHYVLLAFLLVLDYGFENITSIIVLVVSTILIFYWLREKLSSDDHIRSKIIFAVTTPLLFLNVFYYVIFYPEVVDTETLGNFKYFMVYEINDDFHSNNVLYKCKKWGFYCDKLYSSIVYGDTKIIIDEKAGEASFYQNSTLIYTDGLNPRYYQGYAATLGEHQYILTLSCDEIDLFSCDSAAYVPYECDLDFKSCAPLLIQYTDYYGNYHLALRTNEETNEVDLVDESEEQPILIFTIGENSRCYVPNCKIIEK